MHHHHKEALRWSFIGAVAIVVMLFMAFSIQKPAQLKNLPGFAPSATPTPLASTNIIVNTPHINDHVTQKLLIQGKARVFENIVSIRLKNQLTGKVYGQTQARTNAKEMGQFGDFIAGVLIDNPELRAGDELVVEVFQTSPNDGKDMDKIAIPVVFTPSEE